MTALSPPRSDMSGFHLKHVANCFLQRDFEDGVPSISPMKIQKLVYCLHGWHLAITDGPAIDGHFEAWPYGPVEEDMYHLFKPYRDRPISTYAMSWEGDEQKAFVVNEKNREFYDILDFVAKKYMPFSALQLSAMTHQPGTPWSLSRSTGGGVIDNELIKQHFRELAS
jgi:uncharacterized phage-associated protein